MISTYTNCEAHNMGVSQRKVFSSHGKMVGLKFKYNSFIEKLQNSVSSKKKKKKKKKKNKSSPRPRPECKKGYGILQGGKTCEKCPKNMYSKNGKCNKCWRSKPITKDFQDGQTTCVKNDLNCEAGEYGGPIDTEGIRNSSNCIAYIETKEECIATAKHNGKEYHMDSSYGNDRPRGCVWSRKYKYYYFNNNKDSTAQCQDKYKCVCKSNTCFKCPPNTYSVGGINAKCSPCAHETNGTACKDTETQRVAANALSTANEAQKTAETAKKQAEGAASAATKAQGAASKAKEKAEGAASAASKAKKKAEGAASAVTEVNNKVKDNDARLTKSQEKAGDIEKTVNTNVENLKNAKEGLQKSIERSKIALGNLEANTNDTFKGVFKKLDEQKTVTNDLSIKNSRLWQKEQIRLQHDKLMQRRKSNDDANEKKSCETQRLKGNVIFPAIEISTEIEKIEDTTCIDTNRDELLKSFCSFTSDLDNLFQIQSIDKEAKSFWPNICCKERKDKTLEACNPPEGSTIKRENIIPFALSQGGDYSRHNLYEEVTDTIKKNGYLHNGMKQLLDSLESIHNSKKQNAKGMVDSFFNDVSLCGPRIVDAPGNPENKLCELFVSYKHAMKTFYSLIESLYMQPVPIQTSSFLETMEKSLRKRSAVKRVGKNNIQQVMQMKPAPKAVDVKCTGGSKWVSSKLKQKKTAFCHGYNHLDLSDANIKNVAVHYLKKDMSNNDKEMFRLSKQLRYQVTDSSCPAPFFTAKDISIQRVAMDTLGKKKEWVAVVNLNTQDKNGYLQSELPYCEEKTYLIGAKVNVKAYVDRTNYCGKIADYDTCKKKCLTECRAGKRSIFSRVCSKQCNKRMLQLKNRHNNKHYSKNVVVTGTQYTVKSSHVSRKRRLLQYGRGGC